MTKKTEKSQKDDDKKKKIQQNYSKRFTLTLHGARNEQLERFKKFCQDDSVVFAIASKESGENSVHPHFQCYFELAKRTLMSKKLRTVFGDNHHLEVAKGTKQANVDYIHGMTKPYEIGWIVFSKGEYETPRGYSSEAMDFMESFVPRTFQKEILDIVEKPADRRTIYWFWDQKGCKGKTVLTKFLHRTYGALLVSGRATDMKHAMTRFREVVKADPTICLVDIARAAGVTKETVLGIEDIKNGVFFSGKYDSGMLDCKKGIHLIVFSNQPPNPVWFSGDRWTVYEIQEDFSTKKCDSLAETFKAWDKTHGRELRRAFR